MKQILDPTSPTDAPRTKVQTIASLTGNDKLRYEADIDPMNWILLGIPNDIYNYVDACQNAKAMWNRVKRLMQGTDLSLQERHLRIINEFVIFFAEAGESIECVYDKFSTLMNNMERNKLLPENIAINMKFLNSLQPEWSKYNEPNVNASRAKRTARNHDPLALVASTYASPSYSRPSEDKLSTAMMLLARAITQYFLTPTNNRLRTSSNTRNQAFVQDDRVYIQGKSSGYAGNSSINAGRNAGIKEIMLGMILFRILLGMLKMFKGIYEPLLILGKLQHLVL
ncbi:hypothetical protein Tco_0108947 [Tanacetum coccineum]